MVHCAITPCTWLTSRALPQEVSKRSLPSLGGGLDTDRESLLVPGYPGYSCRDKPPRWRMQAAHSAVHGTFSKTAISRDWMRNIEKWDQGIMRYHGISWELMGEGALRGKIGVLVTEWRVTFLDALHKDSSPQSLAPHQRVLFSWRKRKQYGPLWSSLRKFPWKTTWMSHATEHLQRRRGANKSWIAILCQAGTQRQTRKWKSDWNSLQVLAFHVMVCVKDWIFQENRRKLQGCGHAQSPQEKTGDDAVANAESEGHGHHSNEGWHCLLSMTHWSTRPGWLQS